MFVKVSKSWLGWKSCWWVGLVTYPWVVHLKAASLGLAPA